ncbi:MAG: hypothetical protein PUC33_08430, partial [Oscillospiraceae bacterium]|nr:hypothetical protein [Oscillospiraceae bacterium]
SVTVKRPFGRFTAAAHGSAPPGATPPVRHSLSLITANLPSAKPAVLSGIHLSRFLPQESPAKKLIYLLYFFGRYSKIKVNKYKESTMS